MSIYVGDFYPLHTGFGDSLSSIYNLYIDFNYSDVYLTTSSGTPIADEDGITLSVSDPVQPIDRISKLDLITDGLAAGRPSYEGVVFDQDEPVVTPSGLLGYGNYENLILWSEDFTNSVWSKFNELTITANQEIAPDGTLTADTYNANRQDNFLRQVTNSGVPDGKIFIMSCFMKAGTATKARLVTLGNGAGLGLTTSVVDLTDAWQNFSIIGDFTSLTGGDAIRMRILPDFSITAPETFYIWGAQVTESSYPLPYIKTEATTVGVPANNAGTGRTIGFPINEPYDASLSDDESAWNRCRENLNLAFDGTDGTDAQGTIELEWTPMFDAGEVGGDNNILSFDGTVNNSGIWYDDVAGAVKASDGTNTASVSVSPVSGTAYNITLAYDVTNGMILSVEEAN